MTISAVSAPRVVYSGSGTLGPFAVSKGGVAITFSDNSHIQVTRFSSATAQSGTVLVEDTDYTLTGGPDAGVVTLISPAQAVLASTDRLLIERIQPKSQALDLSSGGNFSSSAIEARHDREVEMIAEAWDRASRSLEVHFGDGSMKMLPPKSELANNVLGFDANGDPTVGDISGVTDLVGFLDDITIVAAADVDIGLVADSITDVNTVAGSIANVNLVGAALDDGTISDLLDGQVGKVDTNAVLTAIPAANRTDGQVMLVRERTTKGDGGGGLWRFDAASSATANGGTILAPDAGTGRWIRIYSGSVNVRWFGASPSAAASANTTAFRAAIAYLETDTDDRGGVLFVPTGTYNLDDSLDFTAYNLIHGTHLQGEGDTNTVLDFSGASAGTDGVTFGPGTHFGIEDIFIANAPRYNIVIGRGNTTGGANYCNHYDVTNVRTQGAGSNGLLSVNSYLGEYRNVWSKDNTGTGIVFSGFHTAISVDRCESSGNGSAGWDLNGIAYSTFQNCGSDDNTLQGYSCSNMQAVTFLNCGAESNQRDGWALITSDASATGLNAQSSNIVGVVFDGCYGLANSKASAGTYATFIGATTADSRGMDFSIRGGVAHPNAAGDKALILAGASGAIEVAEDGFNRSFFSTADAKSGSYRLKNKTVTGKKCVLQTSGTAQTISNSTGTVMTWNTTAVENTLGATVASTTITIPAGVHRVIAACGVAWASNSTGVRFIEILKSGSNAVGLPQAYFPAQSFSQASVRSAEIDVAAGDTISVRVTQNSGGNLDIFTGPNAAVWFSVEAVD